MKVVLYTHDFIPITVLDVNDSVISYIKKYPWFRVAMHQSYDHTRAYDHGEPCSAAIEYVTIYGSPLRHSEFVAKNWILQLKSMSDSDRIVDLFKEPTRKFQKYYYNDGDTHIERDRFINALANIRI